MFDPLASLRPYCSLDATVYTLLGKLFPKAALFIEHSHCTLFVFQLWTEAMGSNGKTCISTALYSKGVWLHQPRSYAVPVPKSKAKPG